MSRTTRTWLVASLTLATLTAAACTRSDTTGPSDPTPPAFENQGSHT